MRGAAFRRPTRLTHRASRSSVSGMAARYWPGENPLGKRIRLAGPNPMWAEVVGVAADAKFRLFTAGLDAFPVSAAAAEPADAKHAGRENGRGIRGRWPRPVRAAILETDRDVPILACARWRISITRAPGTSTSSSCAPLPAWAPWAWCWR